MHDIRQIRKDSSEFDRQMLRRGLRACSADILSVDSKKRITLTDLQTLQEKRNSISKKVGEAKRAGQAADQLVEDVGRLKNEIGELEQMDREHLLKNIRAVSMTLQYGRMYLIKVKFFRFSLVGLESLQIQFTLMVQHASVQMQQREM